MNLGIPELLIILFVLLLIFGGGSLPGLGRSLGRAVRSLRGRDAAARRSRPPKDLPGPESAPAYGFAADPPARRLRADLGFHRASLASQIPSS